MMRFPVDAFRRSTRDLMARAQRFTAEFVPTEDLEAGSDAANDFEGFKRGFLFGYERALAAVNQVIDDIHADNCDEDLGDDDDAVFVEPDSDDDDDDEGERNAYRDRDRVVYTTTTAAV
jgi:phosphopantothenoylcysteine synthetase/decarboxylase